MKKIGEQLKEYFRIAGISQKELAERLGVSNAHISALFRGETRFGRKSAEKWGEMFGFNPTFLITGDGELIRYQLFDSEDVRGRLLDFVSHKGLSKSAFEKAAGLSNGYLNNFRGNIGAAKLECILNAYPELNRDWLLNGRGGMINESGIEPIEESLNDSEDVLSHILNELMEQRRLMAEVISVNKEMAATNRDIVATNRELARTNSEVVLASRENSERFLLALERLTQDR